MTVSGFTQLGLVEMTRKRTRESLAMLSDFIGKPVSMQVESLYHQEQYDIVLM